MAESSKWRIKSVYYQVGILLAFGLDNSSLWRALLCIVGCLESLMLVAFLSHYHIHKQPCISRRFPGWGSILRTTGRLFLRILSALTFCERIFIWGMTEREKGNAMTEKSLLLPNIKQFYFKMNVFRGFMSPYPQIYQPLMMFQDE